MDSQPKIQIFVSLDFLWFDEIFPGFEFMLTRKSHVASYCLDTLRHDLWNKHTTITENAHPPIFCENNRQWGHQLFLSLQQHIFDVSCQLCEVRWYYERRRLRDADIFIAIVCITRPCWLWDTNFLTTCFYSQKLNIIGLSPINLRSMLIKKMLGSRVRKLFGNWNLI